VTKTRYPIHFFGAMAASTLFFTAFLVMVPVLPLYTLDIGGNEAAWGLATTVIAAMAASVRLAGGSVSDRLGRRGVMLFGALANMLASVILLLTNNLAGLMVSRAMHGLGIGVFTTSYKALIVDFAPEGKQGEAVGIGNLTFGIAMTLSTPLGEWLYQRYGYDQVFYLGVALALACGIVVSVIGMGEQSKTGQSMLKGAIQILPRRSTQIGIWGMLSIAATFTAILTFLPLLASLRGLTGVGLALSGYSLMQIIGQPIGGKLGDRFGWRLVIIPGFLITALGVYSLLIADKPGLIIIGSTLVGLGGAIARVGLDVIVMDGTPRDLRGTAAGLEYAGLDVWNGLFGWVMGIIVLQTNYSTIYTIMTVTPVIWAVILWFMIPRNLGRVERIPVAGSAGDR
jgi:MFS family permease